MVNRCILCKSSGNRGFFRFPEDSRRDEWVKICDLTADSRVDNLRICFRHFATNKLVFRGTSLKPSKGKLLHYDMKG